MAEADLGWGGRDYIGEYIFSRGRVNRGGLDGNGSEGPRDIYITGREYRIGPRYKGLQPQRVVSSIIRQGTFT